MWARSFFFFFFFLKQEYKRIFFPERFWIFLCCGSLTSSHLLPTWVTYKPAVITLQISNTARSKYTYVLCFLSFAFPGCRRQILSCWRCCHLPYFPPSELKRDHISSDSPAGRLLKRQQWVLSSPSFYLQCFGFPACHHGHASSYFLTSSWQTESILDTPFYRDAASGRDQQN